MVAVTRCNQNRSKVGHNLLKLTTPFLKKHSEFQVDLVVNHNVPRSPKEYVHRVGRSARAGRFGAAVTFVTQHDLLLLQAIEEAIGKKLDQLKVGLGLNPAMFNNV